MWEIIFLINKVEPNAVFVGSVASFLNSVLDEGKSIYDCKDIDIVINDTTNLETISDVFKYEGSSVYSLTKKRAYMVYKDVLVDIFIDTVDEDDIRIFKVGDSNLKIMNLRAQVEYYKERLEKTPKEVKDVLEEKYRIHHNALISNKNIL